MESRALTLASAILSAAIILGCQDQGSSPVGPQELAPQFDHKPGHNPGGGGGGGGGANEPDGTVDLTSGLITFGTPVTYCVELDNKKTRKLAACSNEVDTPGGTFGADFDVDFSASQAAALANLASCGSNPEDMSDADKAFLLKLIVDTGDERALNIAIDKDAFPGTSADHAVTSTSLDDVENNPTPGPFTIWVGSSDLLPGFEMHVDKADPAAVTGEYTFTGGAVSILDRRSRDVKIGTVACPFIGDVITMTFD